MLIDCGEQLLKDVDEMRDELHKQVDLIVLLEINYLCM